VIAGHSSFFKNAPGRYKTVFANLMELDPGEEVWVFSKQGAHGDMKLYRYLVTNSYNTNPQDGKIVLPSTGSAILTLFTCTPVGGIDGRWIIRAELIREDGDSCSVTFANGEHVSGTWKGDLCYRTAPAPVTGKTPVS